MADRPGVPPPLVLYDISSPLRPRASYAPNPAKARYALSFKGAPFATEWVDILDIPSTRKALACAPVRKLDDGSDSTTRCPCCTTPPRARSLATHS